MKKSILILAIGLLFFSCQNNKRTKDKTSQDFRETELKWLKNWFNAWELIYNDVLKLPRSNPPILLFYDGKYVYTTSEISAPNGEKFNGPKLFGEELPWRRAIHNDTLTLPNSQRVPVQLMTFAAPSEKEGVESFFVMAAPSFWQSAGINSKEVGLDKMLTGVFLHEFAHTKQMNGIGLKITEFEKNHAFDFNVNDDIIQNYFSKDSIYVKEFKKEIELFYRAAEAKSDKERKKLARLGLEYLRKRQENYLKPEKEILVEMDNIFLSMEGIGQYMMVAWLTHPKGGNEPIDLAIRATRRNRKWWSQDEGLALVWLYTRLAVKSNWERLFSKNPPNIISMIKNELN